MNNQKLLLCLIAFFILNAGYATDYISIKDGNWNNPANWSPNGIPNIGATAAWPGDNVIIEHEISFTGNLTTAKKASIQIKPGGHFIISETLNIGNTNASYFQLDPGGKLSSGNLIISSSSNQIALNGTVSTGDFTFTASVPLQIGGQVNITNNFNASGGTPIEFTGGSFTVGGNSTINGSVRLLVDGNAQLSLGNTSLVGDADIIGVNAGGSLVFNTLSLASGSTIISCANNACLYSGNASSGTPPNPLNLLTGAQLLPVTLINYTAKKDEKEVVLSWATSAELDNDFFLLEHSNDGQSFRELATIKGHQNSQQVENYSFRHLQPWAGNNYYRLTQFDLDGTKSVLGLRLIDYKDSAFHELSVYPNPIRSGQQLFLDVATNEQPAYIHLLSANGQRLALPYSAGQQQLNLPTNLPAGLYYLNVTSPSDSKTLPLVVVE